MKRSLTFISILIAVFCLTTYSQAETEKFDTQSVINAHVKQINPTSGEVALTMKKGWHVNANPSSLDFLIPTEIMPQDSAKSIKVFYPDGHKVETPLGDLLVYSGETIITFTVKEGDMPKAVSLTAQACDGTICYPPSTWVLPISSD